MSTFRAFLWLVLLIGVTSAVAVGQPRSATATIGVPIALPQALEVDVRDQSDSPLQLSIDEKVRGRMPGTPLSVRNVGSSTIEAFVLRVDIEPYGLNQMVILGPKGLGIGESRIQALGAPRIDPRAAATPKPAVSVDFVRFTDGRTWGEDSLGRSKHIAAYVEGRSLALSRLNDLLTGQDDTDIRKAFDVFGSSSFTEPSLTPPGRPDRAMDWRSRGYEEVLNILRRMPRGSGLARDLARRIEIMGLPIN